MEFTQFLRPYGNKKTVYIYRAEDIEKKALEVRQNGIRFECEVLTTGEVSLTAEKGESTIAIEVVPNGPGIEEAVDRIVNKAWETEFGKK